MYQGKIITIKRSLEYIDVIFDEIDIFVDVMFDQEVNTLPFKLAVGEMISNCVKHCGFKSYKSKKLDIIIKPHDEDSLQVTIIDKSDPFNPIATPTPDMRNYLEEKKIGNMGLFIVKKIIDKMLYEYDGESNKIDMIYYFNKPELKLAA